MVNGNLFLGQAYGHPTTTVSGVVNASGTSVNDRNVAASSGVNIYSIEAYNTPVGGQSIINRVTPDGTQTNNVGRTQGSSGSGNFNIGMDALKRWSGF